MIQQFFLLNSTYYNITKRIIESKMKIVKWRNPFYFILFISLCLTTVAGNCLVVIAVCTKKYLRNPTGYLIVSLAIADLIVGLVVMPLNSLYEMTNHTWLLGLPMCDLFHALDILASTSSIWNLCIIGIDRYMSGYDPIGYRKRVSKRRIIIAIAFVWITSLCLSFPGIVWWRWSSPHLYVDDQQCAFTDSKLYIIFSSLFSYYIPLILILFSYGGVFLIATEHSKSVKSGVKQVEICNVNSNSHSNEESTLRIHQGQNKSNASKKNENGYKNNNNNLIANRINNLNSKQKTYGTLLPAMCDLDYTNQKKNFNQFQFSFDAITKYVIKNLETNKRKQSVINLKKIDSNNKNLIKNWDTNLNFTDCHSQNDFNITTEMTKLTPKLSSPIMNNESKNKNQTYSTLSTNSSNENCNLFRKKITMREKSKFMVKYVYEQRAARTLSIVVGVFILCWTPFFLLSPIMVLCKNCIKNRETFYSVITWVGHLNSMLNPLIYSRFSRDFRKAFKQILTCQHKHNTQKAIRTPLNLMLAQLASVTQIPSSSTVPILRKCDTDIASPTE